MEKVIPFFFDLTKWFLKYCCYRTITNLCKFLWQKKKKIKGHLSKKNYKSFKINVRLQWEMRSGLWRKKWNQFHSGTVYILKNSFYFVAQIHRVSVLTNPRVATKKNITFVFLYFSYNFFITFLLLCLRSENFSL